MPKIIIDGKEIEFQPGQTIIQAAKDHGIDIPHFCWHPSLSVSGNCRVCLVEVEKMPKLVIACATIAADGMVVHTQSEKTLSARNAVMEFILINHPLDCPICDEAGECKLQDYTYQHSVGESRFTETKQHKDKRVELGPYVMFDGERCISCSRCIRFCDEVAGENQLTFVKRGDRVTIVTFPGKQLDNPYSLNVTDICPVGALTNRDFRFKSRVWEMSSTKTICNGCSRGCNTDMWVRSNEILRLTPRQNDSVNSYWMCDRGRLETFKFVNQEDRVNGPHLRREGKLTKVGWDEVFAASVSELKSFNKDEVAFIGSAFSTVEDNFLFSKFAKSVFGSKHIDFPRQIISGSGDNILIKEDKRPNSFGSELVGIKPAISGMDFNQIMKAVEDGKIKALYVVEEDLIELNPDYENAIAKLDLLIVHATNFNKMTKYANIVFPSSTYAEKNGTWVNFEGRVQRIHPAVSTFDLDRSLDGMSMSRLDKFGTEYDSWGKVKKADARSTWRILSGLANAFGTKYKYTMAEEVFADIAKSIDSFKDIDYDLIGELGAQLKVKTHTAKV
jgi:NADH-quinone oxidoreductase subunit G